jgi:hypothetical protein
MAASPLVFSLRQRFFAEHYASQIYPMRRLAIMLTTLNVITTSPA